MRAHCATRAMWGGPARARARRRTMTVDLKRTSTTSLLAPASAASAFSSFLSPLSLERFAFRLPPFGAADGAGGAGGGFSRRSSLRASTARGGRGQCAAGASPCPRARPARNGGGPAHPSSSSSRPPPSSPRSSSSGTATATGGPPRRPTRPGSGPRSSRRPRTPSSRTTPRSFFGGRHAGCSASCECRRGLALMMWYVHDRNQGQIMRQGIAPRVQLRRGRRASPARPAPTQTFREPRQIMCEELRAGAADDASRTRLRCIIGLTRHHRGAPAQPPPRARPAPPRPPPAAPARQALT